MKQTNLTGYGTIGCRIELNHTDMVALGVEVSVIKDFLHSFKTDPETKISLQEITAINRIVFFLEKFAIIPSKTNVFTDSPLDFKKADETVDTDDEKIRKELLEHCINRRDGKQVCVDASDYRRWANWLGKQENKTDETNAVVEPAPEDDVITVNIEDYKKIAKLTIIIYRASDASIIRINDTLSLAKERCVSYISFRCINKRKEEVVNELIDAGYQIVPNGVNQSLRL